MPEFDPKKLPFFQPERSYDIKEGIGFFEYSVEVAADEVFLMKSDSQIVYVNQSACERLGYENNELTGKFVWEWDPLFPKEVWPGFWKEFTEKKHLHFETQHQTSTGEIFPVEIHAHYYSEDGQDYLLAFVNDLSEKKRIEEVLLDYQQHLEELVEARTAELKSANDIAEARRKEAEKASRAKSDFLSSMSHELRTPLNAILGFAQLLEMDKGLDKLQTDNAREIHRAGRHLLQLIGEVLDLSKIESGMMNPSIEGVALEEIIKECLHLARPLTQRDNISITTENFSSIFVNADRVRLRQALINLISNGIKYNRPQGNVHLSCSLIDNEMVHIEVTDTGWGIDPEDLNKIFEPFNRLQYETSNIEGTGVGLAITSSLVEMMGGEIGVESTKGNGSTFWFTLPLAEANEARQPSTPSTTDATHTDGIPSRVSTVLYVEDNPSNIRLMTRFLSLLPNINLVTAELPGLGLELLATQGADLILLDINMPEMSGYEFLDIIRSDDQYRDIPVFAVTASALDRDIRKGKNAGFNEYLTKPIDMDNLNALLDQYLKSEPDA